MGASMQIESNRNWVGMLEISYIPEDDIVVFYIPTKVDMFRLTMDQTSSLSSILSHFVEKHHAKSRAEQTPKKRKS